MNTTTFILSKADAKAMLEPYAQEFHKEIEGGFNDFHEAQVIKPVFENLTKSAKVWDYILQRMKKMVLRHNGNLRMEKSRRMYFIVIKDKIALRFKKFDSDYKSGNIGTKQVSRFRNRAFKFQNSYLFPIEIGWQVDKFYSLMQVDFITPNGKDNLWRLPVRKKETNYNEIFPLEEKDQIQIVTLNSGTEDAKTAG